MGRNNKDFFHGSDHEFQPGDMITPQGREPFAWASTNKDVASSYGKNLYHVEPSADSERVKAAAAKFGIHASPTGYKVIKRAS